MKIIRVLSVAVLMGQVGFGVAYAQSSLKTEIPAEFPPQSYKGKQYVDSRGCVYIRAGIDGNVTWIPRMTRSRQHICNAQPTAIARADPAPASNSAPAPVILPAPAPKAAAAPKPAAKPAVRTAVAPAPKPAAAAPKAAQKRAQAQPKRIRVAPPVQIVPAAKPATTARRVAVPARKTVTKRVPVARSTDTACTWASPVSAPYLRGDGVRCGPQTLSPVGTGADDGAVMAKPMRVVAMTPGRAAPGAVRVTPTTRIVPRHVAIAQAQAADVGPVPKGYRKVWDDDRLNPRRAHQTLEGKRMMDLRWTRDVPRRLIDITTGQDVTVFNPDLVYPFTTLEQQAMAQRPGARVYRVESTVSSKGTVDTRRAPVLSSRSAPKTPTPKATAASKPLRVAVSHRFVQVGTYASDAAARGDAARLKRAGLTVRMGTLHRGEKSARVLLAGPYSSPQKLGNALHAARLAGFAGAFTRK